MGSVALGLGALAGCGGDDDSAAKWCASVDRYFKTLVPRPRSLAASVGPCRAPLRPAGRDLEARAEASQPCATLAGLPGGSGWETR